MVELLKQMHIQTQIHYHRTIITIFDALSEGVLSLQLAIRHRKYKKAHICVAPLSC